MGSVQEVRRKSSTRNKKIVPSRFKQTSVLYGFDKLKLSGSNQDRSTSNIFRDNQSKKFACHENIMCETMEPSCYCDGKSSPFSVHASSI